MSAVHVSLQGLLKAGDQPGGGPGAVRLLPLDHLRMAAPLRGGGDLCGRHRHRRLEERGQAQHQGLPGGEPGQSAAEVTALGAVAEIAHAAGAQADRRQRLSRPRSSRSPWPWAPTSSSIRPPSTSTARARFAGRGDSLGAMDLMTGGPTRDILRPHGPGHVAVQQLDLLNVAGDPGTARAQADRQTPGAVANVIARAQQDPSDHLLRPARPPAGGDHRQPDDRRRHTSSPSTSGPARPPGCSWTRCRSSTFPTNLGDVQVHGEPTPARPPTGPCRKPNGWRSA